MNKFNITRNGKTGLTPYGKNTGISKLFILGILTISLIAFAPVVDAGCSCSSGTWDPSGFLNTDSEAGQPVQTGSTQNSAAQSSGSVAPKTIDRYDSFPNDDILKPMKSVSSSETVLDVSNGEGYAESHIKNAIHIPTKDFLDGEGNLKTTEELAKILGDAGVSIDDSIVVYGTSESSGEAEFAFLVLSYLGQKEVKLLDGNLADWKATGLPVEAQENKKPGVDYKPEVKSEIIAEYEYVKSGKAQIVDARPFVEFGKGRIPGSSAFDPANIIKGEKIKDGGDLSTVFDRLSKETPIVVYSSDYSRSSLVWYALQLMGYEASVYTWEDWKAHESTDTKEDTVLPGDDRVSSKYVKLGST
jgi:thiosulfate/3-mercaptopyruvate sulfurtransferase